MTFSEVKSVLLQPSGTFKSAILQPCLKVCFSPRWHNACEKGGQSQQNVHLARCLSCLGAPSCTEINTVMGVPGPRPFHKPEWPNQLWLLLSPVPILLCCQQEKATQATKLVSPSSLIGLLFIPNQMNKMVTHPIIQFFMLIISGLGIASTGLGDLVLLLWGTDHQREHAQLCADREHTQCNRGLS